MILSIVTLLNHDEKLLSGITERLPKAEKVPKDESYIIPVPLDSDAFAGELARRCAEFELIVNDPELFKELSSIWARCRETVWQELFNSQWYKYNPIWNKDGKYTEHYNESGSSTHKQDDTETGIENSVDDGSFSGNNELVIDTRTAGSEQYQRNLTEDIDGKTQSQESVSAFNSTDPQPRNKTVEEEERSVVQSGNSGTESSTENTGTETTSISGTDKNTINRTKEGTLSRTVEDSEQKEHSLERIEQGNIGVTMTQDMIEKQRSVVQFNIYNYIIEEFKKEFCLCIY